MVTRARNLLPAAKSSATSHFHTYAALIQSRSSSISGMWCWQKRGGHQTTDDVVVDGGQRTLPQAELKKAETAVHAIENIHHAELKAAEEKRAPLSKKHAVLPSDVKELRLILDAERSSSRNARWICPRPCRRWWTCPATPAPEAGWSSCSRLSDRNRCTSVSLHSHCWYCSDSSFHFNGWSLLMTSSPLTWPGPMMSSLEI